MVSILSMYIDNISTLFLHSIITKGLCLYSHFFLSERGENVSMNSSEDVKRWTEGLENHERMKKILPFMYEDEGYL